MLIDFNNTDRDEYFTNTYQNVRIDENFRDIYGLAVTTLKLLTLGHLESLEEYKKDNQKFKIFLKSKIFDKYNNQSNKIYHLPEEFCNLLENMLGLEKSMYNIDEILNKLTRLKNQITINAEVSITYKDEFYARRAEIRKIFNDKIYASKISDDGFKLVDNLRGKYEKIFEF